MAESVHHVSVVTADPAAVIRFLGVLGMSPLAEVEVPRAEVADMLGLEQDSGTVRSTILGNGTAGLIEVIALVEAVEPAPNAGPVAGLLQLAVLVEDVSDVLAECDDVVADVVGPRELAVAGGRVLVASVSVAGVRFQLTQPLGRASPKKRSEA